VRRTTEFYMARLHKRLYPGAKLTLLETCYVLAREKVQFRQTDKHCDRQLRFYSDQVLPPGNLHPPSIHVLEKCIQCKHASEFEEHVCVNDCCRFPKLSSEEYATHHDDKCSKCGELRFAARRVAGGVLFRPRKVFWSFGLRNTIRRLFQDAEFCQERGRGRQMTFTDFYNSPDARRIDVLTGGALSDFLNSVYELCFDSCQTFTFRQWSIGVMGLR
jgi:hypothetical protein